MIDPEESPPPQSLLSFLVFGCRIEEATKAEKKQFCQWWKRQEKFFGKYTLRRKSAAYRRRPNPEQWLVGLEPARRGLFARLRDARIIRRIKAKLDQ